MKDRLGEALGIGVVVSPGAVLPLVDTGLGDDNACRQVLAEKPTPNAPSEGSSTPR